MRGTYYGVFTYRGKSGKLRRDFGKIQVVVDPDERKKIKNTASGLDPDERKLGSLQLTGRSEGWQVGRWPGTGGKSEGWQVGDRVSGANCAAIPQSLRRDMEDLKDWTLETQIVSDFSGG